MILMKFSLVKHYIVLTPLKTNGFTKLRGEIIDKKKTYKDKTVHLRNSSESYNENRLFNKNIAVYKYINFYIEKCY